MTIETELIARAYQAQIYTLNSNGYPTGQSLTPDSASGTLASYMIPGFVEYKPPTPTRNDLWEYSNERYRNHKRGTVQSFNAGQLVLSRRDTFVNRLAGGSDQDTATLSGHVLSSSNTMNSLPISCGLILSAGSLNNPGKIINIMLPKVQLSPAVTGVNQTTGKNPGNQVYDISLDIASRTPLGLLYSGTGLHVEGDEDTDLFDTADGVMVITARVDDGSQTSVTLPFTPFSAEVLGVINSINKNGSDAHASASGISGKVLSFTHGTAGDIWVFGTPVPLANIPLLN